MMSRLRRMSLANYKPLIVFQTTHIAMNRGIYKLPSPFFILRAVISWRDLVSNQKFMVLYQNLRFNQIVLPVIIDLTKLEIVKDNFQGKRAYYVVNCKFSWIYRQANSHLILKKINYKILNHYNKKDILPTFYQIRSNSFFIDFLQRLAFQRYKQHSRIQNLKYLTCKAAGPTIHSDTNNKYDIDPNITYLIVVPKSIASKDRLSLYISSLKMSRLIIESKIYTSYYHPQKSYIFVQISNKQFFTFIIMLQKNKRELTQQGATSAKILLEATGATCKITGLTLSTVSSLYAMKYMATFGVGLVQYLPLIFAAKPEMGFADHMQKTNSLSWTAIGKTALILVGGILIRQFGMLLTNKSFIQAIERRLQRKSKEQQPQTENIIKEEKSQ